MKFLCCIIFSIFLTFACGDPTLPKVVKVSLKYFNGVNYLTIRLRARYFYEVIVDEGEARINYMHAD